MASFGFCFNSDGILRDTSMFQGGLNLQPLSPDRQAFNAIKDIFIRIIQLPTINSTTNTQEVPNTEEVKRKKTVINSISEDNKSIIVHSFTESGNNDNNIWYIVWIGYFCILLEIQLTPEELQEIITYLHINLIIDKNNPMLNNIQAMLVSHCSDGFPPMPVTFGGNSKMKKPKSKSKKRKPRKRKLSQKNRLKKKLL